MHYGRLAGDQGPGDTVEILIQSRSVYGVTKFYPMNRAAETLAAIAGTVTLSEGTLRLAECLGHTVRELPVLARV